MFHMCLSTVPQKDEEFAVDFTYDVNKQLLAVVTLISFNQTIDSDFSSNKYQSS